jgi:hypothetical protein
MSISADRLDRAWRKVGMVVEAKRDMHAYLVHSGKRIIATRRSLGRGKVSDRIGQYIRQQMRLNEDQFGLFLSCPLGRDDYLDILRRKGLLPGTP